MSARVTPLEVNAGRRAFAQAQELFSGAPIATPLTLDVGWYDSTVNAETGCFAVVDVNGDNTDLVGEIVSVAYADRIVFVYVIDMADIPTSIALYRRAFGAISQLGATSIEATVAVVDS